MTVNPFGIKTTADDRPRIANDFALLPGKPGEKRNAIIVATCGKASRTLSVSTHLTVDDLTRFLGVAFELDPDPAATITAGTLNGMDQVLGNSKFAKSGVIFYPASRVRVDRLGTTFTASFSGQFIDCRTSSFEEFSNDIALIDGQGSATGKEFDLADVASTFSMSAAILKLDRDDRPLFRLHAPFGEIVGWLVRRAQENPIPLTNTGRFKKDFMQLSVETSVSMRYFDGGKGVYGEKALKPLIDAREKAIELGLLEKKESELVLGPKAAELGTGSSVLAEATVLLVKDLGPDTYDWYEVFYPEG